MIRAAILRSMISGLMCGVLASPWSNWPLDGSRTTRGAPLLTNSSRWSRTMPPDCPLMYLALSLRTSSHNGKKILSTFAFYLAEFSFHLLISYFLLYNFKYLLFASSVKNVPDLIISNFSLQKNFSQRPNYEQLLQHPFITIHQNREADVATFVSEILDLPD